MFLTYFLFITFLYLLSKNSYFNILTSISQLQNKKSTFIQQPNQKSFYIPKLQLNNYILISILTTHSNPHYLPLLLNSPSTNYNLNFYKLTNPKISYKNTFLNFTIQNKTFKFTIYSKKQIFSIHIK